MGSVEDSELAAAAADELMPFHAIHDQVFECDVVGRAGGSETRKSVRGWAHGEVPRHVVVVLGV